MRISKRSSNFCFRISDRLSMKPRDYAVKNWLDFLRLTDNELIKHCRTDVFKATGKGGQKKNKTSNAIRLTLSHLVVTESKSRSKAENIKKALKKLRIAIATDSRHNLVGSDNTISPPNEILPYLHTSEIHINSRNPVFPIFLGYFFVSYIKYKGNWNSLGNELGFTTSQLRKFVGKQGTLKQTFDRMQSEWRTTFASDFEPVES